MQKRCMSHVMWLKFRSLLVALLEKPGYAVLIVQVDEGVEPVEPGVERVEGPNRVEQGVQAQVGRDVDQGLPVWKGEAKHHALVNSGDPLHHDGVSLVHIFNLGSARIIIADYLN